ncbi:MAG: hypothetical protein VKJ85_03530 [Prochlorothrix sp.]|nr:hypothetical protein [Prochlorothrix sp.]
MLPRSLRLTTTKLNQIKLPDLSRWLPGRSDELDGDADFPAVLASGSGLGPGLGTPRSIWVQRAILGGVGVLLLGLAYQLGRSGADTTPLSPQTETGSPSIAATGGEGSTAAALGAGTGATVDSTAGTGTNPVNPTAATPATPETTALLQSIPQFEPRSLPPVPVPASPTDPSSVAAALDPASRVEQRLAEAPRGRANPFAGFAIDPQNITVKTEPVSAVAPAPASVQTAPVQTAPVQTAPAQTAPVQTAPASAPVQSAPAQTTPVQPSIAAVPQVATTQVAAPQSPASAPVPLAPPASPTALAETLDIKGIVQFGGEFKLIIKEDGATSTRTVQVGDRVAGGRVLIRRIHVPAGGSPQVTLEQNGETIVRAVS